MAISRIRRIDASASEEINCAPIKRTGLQRNTTTIKHRRMVRLAHPTVEKGQREKESQLLPCDEQEQTAIVQCNPSVDTELQRVQVPPHYSTRKPVKSGGDSGRDTRPENLVVSCFLAETSVDPGHRSPAKAAGVEPSQKSILEATPEYTEDCLPRKEPAHASSAQEATKSKPHSNDAVQLLRSKAIDFCFGCMRWNKASWRLLLACQDCRVCCSSSATWQDHATRVKSAGPRFIYVPTCIGSDPRDAELELAICACGELPRQSGESFPEAPLDMKTVIPSVLITFALVCFALVQSTQARHSIA